MNLAYPLSAIVTAGLVGTVIALIVATVTNKWSPRVFVLLALRLAIGWHFMFEGLHKIHSHRVGPVETSKPFSSEPYFKVAPGPLGAKMRKEFNDAEAEIAAKVKAPDGTTAAEFARKSAELEAAIKAADDAEAAALQKAADDEKQALKAATTDDEKKAARDAGSKARAAAREVASKARRDAQQKLDEFQAGHCPPAVAKLFDGDEMLQRTTDGIKLEAEADLKDVPKNEDKAIKDATAAEMKALAAVRTNSVQYDGPDALNLVQRKLQAERIAADQQAIKEDAKKALAKAKSDAAKAKAEAEEKKAKAAELAPGRVLAAKAAYARWVYGLDRRSATVKFVGDVMMSGPERLDHLAWVKAKAQEAEGRQTDGLGNGTGTDVKRVAEFRTAAITAEADLARDANAFISDLRTALNGGKAIEEKAEETRGQKLDKVTMWFIAVVGACILFGLLTRLACLAAAGFLVMTYLTHPAFPWFPQPPNTEGNPLFVNKNVIEALALVLLALYPTGRWLGLDALVLRPFLKYRGEQPA